MSKLLLTSQISLVKSDDVEQVLQDVTVLHFSGGQAWECPSVSPCVSQLQIRITALRILTKLGQKSKGDELGTVTRPDFPRKIYLINYS